MGSVLKKRQSADVLPMSTPTADSCPVFTNYPGIWEMLTADTFADGEKRQTATVTLFFELGVTKVCLNDRASGVTAWASGTTPSDALDALESGLQGDTLAWRRSGPGRAKKGGK
jgi:hypothetical protein